MRQTQAEVYADEDDEECKLSTVQELPELTDTPSLPRANSDRVKTESRAETENNATSCAEFDKVVESTRYIDADTISSISEKVDAMTRIAAESTNGEQIGQVYSASPTFSDFSS